MASKEGSTLCIITVSDDKKAQFPQLDRWQCRSQPDFHQWRQKWQLSNKSLQGWNTPCVCLRAFTAALHWGFALLYLLYCYTCCMLLVILAILCLVILLLSTVTFLLLYFVGQLIIALVLLPQLVIKEPKPKSWGVNFNPTVRQYERRLSVRNTGSDWLTTQGMMGDARRWLTLETFLFKNKPIMINPISCPYLSFSPCWKQWLLLAWLFAVRWCLVVLTALSSTLYKWALRDLQSRLIITALRDT